MVSKRISSTANAQGLRGLAADIGGSPVCPVGRALPESSRQRRWVPWLRFRGGSGALSHNLLRRTSTPTMLPSSSLDTSEYIEPRSSLAQVISNIRSLALKLHNNTCFDNRVPGYTCVSWAQRAPVCAPISGFVEPRRV